MTLLEITKTRMAELGIAPKRSLGQNFLVSDLVVDKIIARVQSLAPAKLVEVGPGLGSLTSKLFELGAPLQLIELDRSFAEYWRKQSLQVIEDDALKVNWGKLDLPPNSLLVSNLPYQISTSLVIEMCFGPQVVESMVLMFQKEVAERLLAKPRGKAYGLLSPMIQSHWQIEKLLEAGPSAFFPPPKIASQVLVFNRLIPPFPGQEREFLSLLKVSFAQRRKFLIKNLLALGPKFAITQLAEAFDELGLNRKIRAEELSPAQFQKLFARLLTS